MIVQSKHILFKVQSLDNIEILKYNLDNMPKVQHDKSWMLNVPKYNVDNFSNVRTGIIGEGEYFWWLVIEAKIDWWFGDVDQK